MKKYDPVDRDDTRVVRSSRRARLQALLFTASVLGTTLMMIGTSGVKIPIGEGD